MDMNITMIHSEYLGLTIPFPLLDLFILPSLSSVTVSLLIDSLESSE